MRDYVWIIRKLLENGLLTEKDSFILMNGEEAEHISLPFYGTLIIAGTEDEEQQKYIFTRLMEICDETTPVTILIHNGKFLKYTIKEFNNKIMFPVEAVILKSSEIIKKEMEKFTLSPIIDMMKTLREPGGCPWDRSQNHATLRTYFLQEVYEVIDAIEENDLLNLKEELGDVLLQVVFHARIAEEKGEFSMQDVVDGITAKMVKRHPFIFEKMDKEDLSEVLENWEKRKRKEKNRKYLLSGIPKCLPSLLLACIIQKKVSSVGIYDLTAFCKGERLLWRNAAQGEVQTGNGMGEESAGAYLFELARVMQEKGIDPELSLHRFCVNLMRRFSEFEDGIRGCGSFDALSQERLEELWREFNAKV